ncbi:reverse transcriptase domain-containing protein [Bradyrhizobium sp. 174]|uniref:reverse transcriptase domain-containing protein n=1 Tax=Bradyrhizobium sp. 174 TaxID=2782645 RepID=UPI001FFB491F|nr:reverse transcriptase domain-containing protein [Bradyrhizobium sp. 174]MCK1574134.1 trypsin-like peptidase domain-containing protein [Bradyrhizobium sp. 174]
MLSDTAYFTYLGVGAKERQFLEKHAFYRYSEATIPKRRGGTRTLLVPERRLKFLQRRTHLLLTQLYSPRAPVHGFVAHRGAITNANAHQSRPYLLNIDLRNYFGTITRRRVLGMLQSMGLDEAVALAVCSICMTRNQLPQGAPTSPVLSNLIAYSLDRDLMKFAKDYRFRYTRYADDISLSSYAPPVALFEQGVPPPGKMTVEQLSASLRSVITSNGFEIAPEKIWFAGPKSRKEVTGLVVNEFTNLKRTFVRDLRAALHKVETMGGAAAEKDFQARYKTTASLEKILRGRLEWIAQVRGRSFSAYRTLAKRFNQQFPASAVTILPTYAEIAEHAVWVIDFFNGTVCEQGTAFFLEGVGLVTADHVLQNLPVGVSAEIYRPSGGGKKFKATPSSRRCPYRDLAIVDHDIPTGGYLSRPVTSSPERRDDDIIAMGFPNYGPGDQLSKRRGHIIGSATKHGVKFIEVSAMLPGGISGGPILMIAIR